MAKAYINGKFYTMEKEHDTCQAVVVENGKFIYCGSNEGALQMAQDVVDLGGAPVLPGMIDTHQHLFASARNLTRMDLKDVRTMSELLERVRRRAEETPDGQWILGTGFDQEVFTDQRILPTKEMLDAVCPCNPLVLSRYCAHMFSANSMALAAGGIGRGFQPKVPNTVEFDANGEPTGVLFDAAGSDIIALAPDPLGSLEAKKDILEKACRDLNSHGLTGVHPIQGLHCDLPEYLDAYQELNQEGRLTVRVYVNYDELPGQNLHFHTGLGDDMVKYGFYKLYLDGNLGGRNAYMTEPYADDPTNVGTPNYTQEELNALVRAGYERGFQVGAHAIGDRAVEMFTTAIETVYSEHPKPDARFRMIHLALLSDELIERIKKLPVVIDMQPLFISTDLKWVGSRVREDRRKYLYCWRRLIDEGLILTAGSDAPCESYDPIEGIYAVVNRKDMSGFPEGGWYPENSVTVYEAVSMFTKNAAYSSYEENIKGTIAPGKLADFVVLDSDLFEVDPMAIKDIHVEKTYLGGKEVYSRK
ncbi:amidohydrolase [Oscillibacter hominis]|uniref:Amidohydrolase n=1 Tax=Oscillibacter hominis TaxID=2763056 RepID=A0A7G9B1F7_9FIRM|nr:amidohydrolase [Oscillibacter hominis]QNL43388.1 amidohydrolase [Oscillibacter hominis]